MMKMPARIGRAGEEESGVLLHAPGLDLAEALAAALGGAAGAVDDGVDDALVDLVVDEPTALDGGRRRPPLTTPSMPFWLNQ